MITIKLIHPDIGVVDEREGCRALTRKFMEQWRFKYGKKFKECRIEIDGESERKDYVKKKVNGAVQMPGKNHISHSHIDNYG